MKIGTLSISCASAIALLGAGSAAAQNSPEPAQATGSSVADSGGASTGDIVVTARRREESLQDVPISVTAMSGAALEQQNIRAITDVAVPSLTITTAASQRNIVSYAMRGQRTQENQLLSDPAVGTYFAEVIQPRPYGFGQSLYDIQSVQVLKGVQGTLFGRNMTGGAVLVEPNRPTYDLGAELRGSYGNFDLREIYGMVNLPLVTDGLAVRVAGKVRKRDGWARDVATGRDYDNQDYRTFRVSLLFEPNDRITSLTIVDYFRASEHGGAVFLTALSNNPNATPRTPLGSHERLRLQGRPLSNVNAALAEAQALFAQKRYRFNIGTTGAGGLLDPFGQRPFERNSNVGVQNKTSIDLGGATLKNIIGYRHVRRDTIQDYDGTPLFIITPNQKSNIRNFNEELQLQGTAFNSNLSYTLGAFYFTEKGSDGARTSTLPESTIFAALGAGGLATTPAILYSSDNFARGKARSYAFYGAGTYKLGDQFSLSAGLRYNNDKRWATVFPRRSFLNQCLFDTDNIPATPAPPIGQCVFNSSKSWDAFTWDVTAQFEPSEDLTIYAATRRGFRSGGFSLRANSEATFRPYNPEKVQEYEVGLKTRSDLGGALLTTSSAVFLQDYTNVQRQNPVGVDTNGDGIPDLIATIIANTAAQKNYGGELEVNLRFDFGLTLSGYYSYVDITDVEGLPAGEFLMRGIPHHQAGGTISYTLPTSPEMGEVTLSGGLSYQSRVPLDDRDAPGIQPGYALAKFRLNWENVGGSRISAAAFVNNAFNKLYRVGALGVLTEVGFLSSVYGEPRTYGLEVGFKF